MTALNVGDLVKIRNGPPGVLAGLEGTGAKVELSPGEFLYCQLGDLARVDGDQLMADTVAAETTELPRVENLFAPAQLPPRLLPVPEVPDLARRPGAAADDLTSMLILLDCLTGLDFARAHPDWTPSERLEHVERVRETATTELLQLIEKRLLAMGPEPDRTLVAGRHGR